MGIKETAGTNLWLSEKGGCREVEYDGINERVSGFCLGTAFWA